jgi:branched-chain amino acid transport system ATP-binding protein
LREGSLALSLKEIELGMKTMAMLESRNVTRNFGRLTAVSNLSFEVEKGEIFGIAGPNGAGKTTLFNLIAGVYPCSGEIVFQGQKINGLRPHSICQMGIARTFQIPLVFPSLTVYENVETGAHFGNDKGEDEKRIVSETLDFVGLKGKENVTAKHLRLFDKKMTMLAAALATKPQLLLLDEPAGGLNPAEIKQSVSLFKRVNEELGITIIMIEHLMKVLMDISQRLMILHNGEKTCIGSAETVGRDKKVIEVYLGIDHA